jgi:hypothetical protein
MIGAGVSRVKGEDGVFRVFYYTASAKGDNWRGVETLQAPSCYL